jgi:pimeloyl-ACP methyl ester carboxylesterase
MRTRRLRANGLGFALLETGPMDGPLALCLHGFPDSAWTWRELLPALGEAGHHAVAPFLRGFAPSEAGPGSPVDDVLALHEVLGGDGRAVLIGHDLGAALACAAAGAGPWHRIVALSWPQVLAGPIETWGYERLRRHWHMLLFRLPEAERIVAADDLDLIGGLWEDWAPGYDTAQDVRLAKEALRGPDRLATALAPYRSLPSDPPRWTQPTLCLLGEGETATGTELPPGSQVELVPGGGHVPHLQRPERVREIVLGFLHT